MGVLKNAIEKIRRVLKKEPKKLEEVTKKIDREDVDGMLTETGETKKEEVKKFTEELQPKIEQYTRNEAIMIILQKLGMKPEIAQNEDARREVLRIANEELKDFSDIRSENLALVENHLSPLIEDRYGEVGSIKKEKSELLTPPPPGEPFYHDTKITIDVNKKGQMLKTESRYDFDRTHHKVISYAWTKTTIESGIEMEKEYQGNQDCQKSKSEKNYTHYILERNHDLVTARLKVFNVLDDRQIEEEIWCTGQYGDTFPRHSQDTNIDPFGFECNYNTIVERRRARKGHNNFAVMSEEEREELAHLEGISREMKDDEINEEKKEYLEWAAKINENFRKMAIARGLIETPEKEETTKV